MSMFLLISRIALALVFGIAGIGKIADPSGSRRSLAGFGVPRVLVNPLVWLLPVAEIGCAMALIPVASAWYGALGVMVLLIGFTAAIGTSLIRGRRPDCHCFGQLHSEPVGWKTLVRNIVLACISGCVVVAGRDNPGAGIFSWSHRMNPGSSAISGLVIAIAALAIFELWALIHLLRQNGRLMLRLDAVEARLAASAEPPAPGLPVDTEAPAFSLPNLIGHTVTLEALEQRGKPIVLFFTEPGCGACDTALPELSQWQRDYRNVLSIVPVSRGDVAENRAKSAKYGLEDVLLQVDREVAEAYKSEGTPGAVLIRRGRIDAPLAVGLESIRALVARAALPDTVHNGDVVPSIKLPDLSGKLFDVATFANRRTMMLFWSPSCGFCQQM